MHIKRIIITISSLSHVHTKQETNCPAYIIHVCTIILSKNGYIPEIN